MLRKNDRIIRAPRGNKLNTLSWQTEAPLRMLMNNLDPDVAERPEELVVYGGIGRAARNWEAFDQITASLKRLRDDQTLLVQSGKPVGIFPTHPGAPRVIIANGNLVPKWATWEVFNELDRKGLMMYGQMTAGSWIYIGSQGIVQGTYETFSEIGRRHFGGTLAGRWFLTAGLGGMGGAQPLAATMAGASILVVECQPSRIEFRQRTGYLDRATTNLDEALAMIDEATKRKTGGFGRSCRKCGGSISGNSRARTACPMWSRTRRPRTTPPTDICRSAGRSRNGASARSAIRTATADAAKRAMAEQVKVILAFKEKGAIAIDYGNNIRAMAMEMGVSNAFDYPGFVEAYVRPLFCVGKGPFRWAALSGDPEDIYRTDAKVRELIPDDPFLATVAGQGARAYQVSGIARRASAGSVLASVTGLASPSTRWSRTAN